MDLLNSIGFVNFWGVTPFVNLLETEKEILSTNKQINILLSNSNDLRHVIYTMYKLYLLKTEEKKNIPQINFYIHEDHRENICRDLLFLHLITDRTKSIVERVEMLMEIYGNTLLPSRTIDYINANYKQIISFICGDKKSNVIYKPIIDLSCLTHKEIDEMVEIISSYDSKVPYDIEKYRNDRVRFCLKDRYDYRNNLFDWDYNMNMCKYAPIVRLQHYIYWRNFGVAFEMRVNIYKFPNRTLSCYIPGKTKGTRDSCMVRGFWGDIVNSPYIGYGLELETRDEISYYYANNKIQYERDSQDVTEYNLIKFLLRLDHNEKYDFMKREYEKERRRKEKIRKQQEEEEKKKKEEEEAAKKPEKKLPELPEVKEEEDEEIDTSVPTKKKEEKKESEKPSEPIKIEKEDDSISKIAQKVAEQVKITSTTPEEDFINVESEGASNDPNELLKVFKDLDIKIYFASGDIEKSIYRKKKFNNFFDIILYGFHSSSKFNEMQKQVLKKSTRILFELNSYMATFNDKQREEYNKKIVELGKNNGFVLDDTSIKYIYQFKIKPEQPKEEE